MNSKGFFLLSILAFLAFSQLAIVSCRKSKTNHDLDGFTVDLIHRDSPLSPYYNPSLTPSQRLRDACRRSFSRASFFMNHAIQSDIIPDEGDYLMKIGVGMPPRETFAIADTGSDLTWVQCKPCTHCFKQILPLFDPRKSSTYKKIGCNSKECELVSYAHCVVGKNVCEYEVLYGDNSHSIGDIASETFTFASSTSKTKNISIPHVIFGCGHHNGGTFSSRTAGIVGLGGSKLSIIKQLDKQIQGKFSYCLVPNDDLTPPYRPPNTSSKINFGPKAFVSGPLTTPIFRKDTDIFYYLNLESVSVGGKKLEFRSSSPLVNSSAADEDLGNILIDSGTTLTYLPGEFYDKFESTLLKMIKGERKKSPTEEVPICYETKSIVHIPKIVFHFTNADIKLSRMNVFVKIEDVTCLTIVHGGAIYGNLAQMNFLIGYDLVNHQLSFLPTDCTKHS